VANDDHNVMKFHPRN